MIHHSGGAWLTSFVESQGFKAGIQSFEKNSGICIDDFFVQQACWNPQVSL